MVEKIGELKNQNLNNAQKEMLINWYETNFDSLDDFSFECETDFEGHFLLQIYEKNYFNKIDSAINDYIINILAKGK